MISIPFDIVEYDYQSNKTKTLFLKEINPKFISFCDQFENIIMRFKNEDYTLKRLLDGGVKLKIKDNEKYQIIFFPRK